MGLFRQDFGGFRSGFETVLRAFRRRSQPRFDKTFNISGIHGGPLSGQGGIKRVNKIIRASAVAHAIVGGVTEAQGTGGVPRLTALGMTARLQASTENTPH